MKKIINKIKNLSTIELIDFNGNQIIVRKKEGFEGEYPNRYDFKEYCFKFNNHIIKIHTGIVDYIQVDGVKTQKDNLEFIIVDNIDLKPILQKVDELKDVFKCSCGSEDIKYVKDPSNNENLMICNFCGKIIDGYFRPEDLSKKEYLN